MTDNGRFWKYTGGALAAVALSVVGLAAAGAFTSPPASPTPSNPTQTSDTVDNRSAETITYNVVENSIADASSGCSAMNGEQIAIVNQDGNVLAHSTLGSPQASSKSCTYTAFFESVDASTSTSMLFPTPTDETGVEVQVSALAANGWTVNASIGTPGD